MTDRGQLSLHVSRFACLVCQRRSQGDTCTSGPGRQLAYTHETGEVVFAEATGTRQHVWDIWDVWKQHRIPSSVSRLNSHKLAASYFPVRRCNGAQYPPRAVRCLLAGRQDEGAAGGYCLTSAGSFEPDPDGIAAGIILACGATIRYFPVRSYPGSSILLLAASSAHHRFRNWWRAEAKDRFLDFTAFFPFRPLISRADKPLLNADPPENS
ncbi:hypothetical protein F5144DRAFT_186438 [Chaetomium tenue]|uniref:Uncharacterized protein n=1 Tax=Chaetomium tenue TaxID=1854479 RepID=A0ACB7PE63_9PEZI|nr:hypothetical protein F5144DRAFT_186438 [Chaetomium globosum]